MSHNTLVNYYQTNWAMVHHHNYDTDQIESWMPFERDIYVGQTLDFVEKQREELEKRSR